MQPKAVYIVSGIFQSHNCDYQQCIVILPLTHMVSEASLLWNENMVHMMKANLIYRWIYSMRKQQTSNLQQRRPKHTLHLQNIMLTLKGPEHTHVSLLLQSAQ